MPRSSRIQSPLGIYHVMLRGINKQNIFFCEDDFVRMMTILQEAPYEKAPLTGKVISDNLCTIYAYCILDNHLHILIREGRQNISEIMKRIEDRYAFYYNKKYERTGHLFQARFPSEPVNDSAYFFTLLRYIHRNPVKALEAKTPEDYSYSSWNEYVSHNSNILHVLKPSAIQAVIRKYPLDDLIPWVTLNDPNQFDDGTPTRYTQEDVERANHCLDMDSFRNVITDQDAMEILRDISGITNPEDFRLLDSPTQIHYLLQVIDHGVNIRQAARLGTITEYQLRKAHKIHTTPNNGFSTEYSKSGTVPRFEKTVEEVKKIVALINAIRRIDGELPNITEEQYLHREQLQQQVRQIVGLGKNTYHQLHLIVEYLFMHPDAKCQNIATHLDVSNETVRRFLVRLSNENIVQINGKGKQCTYSLR